MNLKESIRRILREEIKMPLQVKRRINGDSLAELIHDIKSLIDSGYDESDAIYDTVRQFIASKQFKLKNDSEQSYWDSYIEVEEPLVDYLKSKLNIRESVLREETEEYKVKLVTNIIYTLYDNISFIKQSTFNGKPLLIIYFDSDDTAANIESWFDEKISRDIEEWTSGNIVVCPDWIFDWDERKKNADLFINTELIKYDNLGNVVNESVLREEMSSIMRRIYRRADPDKVDKIFGDGIDTMTTRYIQNQHNWHAMNLDKFKTGIVSYVIVDLCMKYSDVCFGAEEYYNKVWEFLLNNYSDAMEEKWEKIMSGEINESILKEDRKAKETISDLVKEFGLIKTSDMVGLSISQIVKVTNIPIDSNIANQILVEMMNNDELKKKYREFEIHASSNGVFFWETMTNTGHFHDDMIENITVAATPFWDGVKYTPVELDWFTLFNEYEDIVYEISPEGGFYRELKHQTNFESVDELLNWYEEFYLPEVYNMVMNTLLPKMHKLVDYEIKQRG